MNKDFETLLTFIPLFARDDFLDRVAKTYSATKFVRGEATRRLQSRLALWNHAEQADADALGPRTHTKAIRTDSTVEGDEAERVIVRALSKRHTDAQFTVTPSGAVYSTHNFGWTKDKVRVFVAGLSPLLDEAAEVFHYQSGGKGGRILFKSDATFVDANHKLVFLRVISDIRKDARNL